MSGNVFDELKARGFIAQVSDEAAVRKMFGEKTAFPGLHAQQKAIAWGVRFSGCTVHFVAAEVDMGPIILQAAVPVLQDDTEEALGGRILREGDKIYPEAVWLCFEGRI